MTDPNSRLRALRYECAASDFHDHDGCSCSDAELQAREARASRLRADVAPAEGDEFSDLISSAARSIEDALSLELTSAEELAAAALASLKVSWRVIAYARSHPDVLAALARGDMVAVLKEPTEEMIAAGWIDKEDVSPAEIWDAMIAAAPSAARKEDKDE